MYVKHVYEVKVLLIIVLKTSSRMLNSLRALLSDIISGDDYLELLLLHYPLDNLDQLYTTDSLH